jgi:hypothetical protein
VLWWNFFGPGDRVHTSTWSHSEITALAEAGCQIDHPAARAARIGWTYANAVHRAGEQLILVKPALSAGEATISHPLAHQLNPLITPARKALYWSAERLIEDEAHHLARRDLSRHSIALTTPPRQRTNWSLPVSATEKLNDRIESATSFERLVNCQMRWFLLDVMRVSRGRVAEIPGPNQLLGNLAHELANRVLPPGPAPDHDVVRAQVDALFDELLAAIATPLQQPEYAGELAGARSRVPAALAELARLLRQIGADVVGTELERDRKFPDGLAVGGRLDLLVQHPVHGQGVIDLKWTKSPKQRRTELSEGRALQLATYAAIANPASATPIPGAYYLLNQRLMIGLPNTFLADEAVESDVTLPETWNNLVSTWQRWRNTARDGTAIATGAEGAEDHVSSDLPIPPGKEPCRYCELTALCRVGVEAN